MEVDSDPPSSPILGADAPHDRNWNEAENNTTVVNQAFELPEAKTVKLRKVLPPLDSSENFGRWYEAVLTVLEPQNLHNLINVEIPRPFRDDTDAITWYLISQKVATFLKESVDSALVKAILDGNACVFADEFMAALKNHLLGKGHSTIQNSAFDVWEAKRSDYDTTGAFLRAMKRRLTRGMRHHAVKPWDAYIVVSRELSQWPEVELAIYRYNCGTSKSQLPDDVTTADFDEFCRYITDWMDRFGYHDSSSDEDL